MKRWWILTVALERAGDVLLARQRARRLADLLDFPLQDQTRIATAVSEIARNAQTYAKNGRVEFGLEGSGRGADSLIVRISDCGPGLADVEDILQGQFSSDTGLGVGIAGARRLMDTFDLQSRVGEGTVVSLSKRLPRGKLFLVEERLVEVTRAIAADVDDDPIVELRNQNQELMRSLEAAEARRLEATELSQELERTNKGVVALYAEIDEKARELQELNTTLEQRVEAAITAQAKVEERLRQSQKMEAVGQLTGGIAHDFNNLLMVIGGSLELLRRRAPDTLAITRLLDAASAGVARGGSLNQQLLAFARKQDLREETFCVNAHVASFLQLIERAVREDITVRQNLSAELWHCCTDRHQLETAVLNLSINARDAMLEGGVLTFSTANLTVDPVAAALWDAQPGDYVAVTVADTGTGIAPEIAARVFEPFFTTKEAGLGTGLGLSQVYGFAKQSGGFVSIESGVKCGARVTIHLKRVEAASAAGSADQTLSIPTRGNGSILLVEDEPAVREMSAEMLRELGYSVAEAETGEEALRILEADNFDLVFSDVILAKGLSGVDLARALAERWPDTPVLLTSGYTAQRLKSDEAPHLKVLTKPYDVNQLAGAIQAVIASHLAD